MSQKWVNCIIQFENPSQGPIHPFLPGYVLLMKVELQCKVVFHFCVREAFRYSMTVVWEFPQITYTLVSSTISKPITRYVVSGSRGRICECEFICMFNYLRIKFVTKIWLVHTYSKTIGAMLIDSDKPVVLTRIRDIGEYHLQCGQKQKTQLVKPAV